MKKVLLTMMAVSSMFMCVNSVNAEETTLTNAEAVKNYIVNTYGYTFEKCSDDNGFGSTCIYDIGIEKNDYGLETIDLPNPITEDFESLSQEEAIKIADEMVKTRANFNKLAYELLTYILDTYGYTAIRGTNNYEEYNGRIYNEAYVLVYDENGERDEELSEKESKEIDLRNVLSKTKEELIKEIQEVYGSPVYEEAKVEVEDNKIDNTGLANIIKDKQIASIDVKDESGNNKVIWSFDGSKMRNLDEVGKSIDLNVTLGTSKNEETINSLVEDNTKSLIVDFSYSGKLPAGTKVSINVQAKYNDGKVLTLHYYNPNTQKLEETATNLVVTNGYVTFDLEHCSEYVLTANEEETTQSSTTTTTEATETTTSNNAQTGVMNVVLYIILAIVSLSGIVATIISLRKKKVA